MDTLDRGLDDGSKDIRIMTAQALAFIGPNASNSVPRLIKMFENGDSRVKSQVMHGPGTIGPPPGIRPPLLVSALDDAEPFAAPAGCKRAGVLFGPEASLAVPGSVRRLTIRA